MGKSVGRPSKYKEEFNEQVYKLALLGATDKDLASFFGVNELTINRWKKSELEFCKSLKAGKEDADARVSESLFHRACGYSHPDVHISNYLGEITVTNLIKYYPPDPTSCIFWLKNRRPDLWRDRPKEGEDEDLSDRGIELFEPPNGRLATIKRFIQ